MNKMTTEHLKRCQAIAEKTGGEKLAAAIAFALAKREANSADMASADLLEHALETGAEVARARYHHKESRAVRLSQAFRAATQEPELLQAFADGYKATYQDLENGELAHEEGKTEGAK